MTPEEAIKEFKERITLIERYGYANLAPEFIEAMKMAISALEKQEQNRWIPCCERLPEESGKYIVTAFDGHKNRVAYVQYIRKIIGWWALSGQRTYWKVIAWMPFPEPYTKEKA